MTEQVIAFRMTLNVGQEAEYARRHDEIWPDLADLLRNIGISEYRIFLDPETRYLFAFLKTDDPTALDDLPRQEILQKWWDYMADLMETEPDNSPRSVDLKQVFCL
jgi:L-rhamnose mutarotase